MAMTARNQQKMLAKAIQIASTAHVNDLDKGGNPYILHCLTVMHKVKSNDPIVKQIAVMHDVLEDHPELWTLERLKKEGFHQRVIDALALLNHAKEVSYDVYIAAIATNIDAILVKMSDLRHNSDIRRMKGEPTQEDFDRVAKYMRSYNFLEKKLKELVENAVCQ